MSSPSLSRIERDSPPPRRKSCLACVKSKRRCDQRLPSCLRCAQRRVTCDYPARVPRSNKAQLCTHDTQPDELVVSTHKVGDHEALEDKMAGQDLWATAGELTDYPALSWSDGFDEPRQLDEGPTTLAGEPEIEWLTMLPLPDIPRSENEPDSPGLLLYPLANGMTSIEASPACQIVPTGLFNMEAISAELDRNLSYAIEMIKSAPSTMLLELRTPWCHASLYKDELPGVMQDALSACALYASKNSINGPVVMRCIDAKVLDLLKAPIPTDFLHALARVQALLMYQIIRFFDGDIPARASAEATFSELQLSARALAGHITWNPHIVPHGANAAGGCEAVVPFPLQASRPVWRAWVLQESARRTFLIASFFVSVWKLLTGRQVATCPDDSALLGQCWTLSAQLWQARDAVDFAVAWRDREHYVVRRRAIISTLMDANGDDIEGFGKMLLTVSMGVEEAKAWLALKGASL